MGNSLHAITPSASLSASHPALCCMHYIPVLHLRTWPLLILVCLLPSLSYINCLLCILALRTFLIDLVVKHSRLFFLPTTTGDPQPAGIVYVHVTEKEERRPSYCGEGLFVLHGWTATGIRRGICPASTGAISISIFSPVFASRVNVDVRASRRCLAQKTLRCGKTSSRGRALRAQHLCLRSPLTHSSLLSARMRRRWQMYRRCLNLPAEESPVDNL